MCGIVGIVHRDRDCPVDPEVVARMCAAIRHRGPDDEGAYVSGPVGLGMRRLSIIDLAGGHQPIANEDGSKVIVFNGEIYNYRELRDDLVRRGHAFRTHSDTETVLHLYEERGPECVEWLRGMFAFAIWDADEPALLLARDRFGIKPLYVTSGRWGVAFASELKALHAVGLAGNELDWDAIDMYLQLGYIAAPATPFRGVRKLEPAHTMVWRADREALVRRYWDLPRPGRNDGMPVACDVRDWIDESVAAHLVSDVPIAAFLSGGLDSSAVVASMATLGYGTHAFSAKYHGSDAAQADETALAASLAERHDARLSVVDIHPKLDEIVESIIYALDEPHADDSAVPTWLLSAAVSAQYKVALTGIGGDELFGGYRRHVGLLLGDYYRRAPRVLRRMLGAAAHGLREPDGASLGVDRLKRFLLADGAGTAERFLGYVSRLRDDERRHLYSDGLRTTLSHTAARARFESIHCAGGARSGFGAGLYLDVKTFLADDVLALSDRLSMAHSLEIRVPLVDHVLAERVFSLPDGLKVGLRRHKPLLRDALGDRLTAEHFGAPKRGFVGPTSAWLRNELRAPLLDELAPARMARLGYFDSRTVERLLDEHFARRHNREGILWALFCFSIWHRLYVECKPAPRYAAARAVAQRVSP